jgi:hypothetical protein
MQWSASSSNHELPRKTKAEAIHCMSLCKLQLFFAKNLCLDREHPSQNTFDALSVAGNAHQRSCCNAVTPFDAYPDNDPNGEANR